MISIFKRLKDRYENSSYLFFAMNSLAFYMIIFLNALIFANDYLSIFSFLVALMLLFLFKSELRLFFILNILFISSIFKFSFFPTSLVTVLVFIFSLFELGIYLSSIFNTKRVNKRGLLVPFILAMTISVYLLLMWMFFKDGRPSVMRVFSFINLIMFIFTILLFLKRNNTLKTTDFPSKLLVDLTLNFVTISVLSLPVFIETIGIKFYEFSNARDYSRFIVKIPGVSFNFLRFASTFQDPNVASFFGVLFLSLILIYYKVFLNHFGKMVTFGIVFFITSISILSFSKMAWGMLIVLFLVLTGQIVFNRFRKKQNNSQLIVIIPLALIFIAYFFFNNIFRSVIARFHEGYSIDFETYINAISTNRFFVVKEVISLFMSDFSLILFGSGIDNMFLISSYGNVAHDTIIQTITNLGVPFSVIFVLFLVSVIKSISIEISPSSVALSDSKWSILLVPTLGFFFLALLTYISLYAVLISITILFLSEQRGNI